MDAAIPRLLSICYGPVGTVVPDAGRKAEMQGKAQTSQKTSGFRGMRFIRGQRREQLWERKHLLPDFHISAQIDCPACEGGSSGFRSRCYDAAGGGVLQAEPKSGFAVRSGSLRGYPGAS